MLTTLAGNLLTMAAIRRGRQNGGNNVKTGGYKEGIEHLTAFGAVAPVLWGARGHRPPNLVQALQIFNWFYSNFA